MNSSVPTWSPAFSTTRARWGVFDQGDPRRSEELLARAIPKLERTGSPLALLARYLKTYTGYRREATYLEIARTEVETLLADFDPNRFPSLAGRAYCRLGITVANLAGEQRSQAGLKYFHEGRELLSRTSGEDLAGIGDMLLAEEYGDVGDAERAWRHRVRALRTLTYSGDPVPSETVGTPGAAPLEHRTCGAPAPLGGADDPEGHDWGR